MYIVIGIALGIITAVMSRMMGYEIDQWEHWAIFALAFVPYSIGVIYGSTRKNK